MADSPRKRPRLSINQPLPATLPIPSTPSRRASYLSPTRASLARSHPNIFSKTTKRGSLTEPRGKLLRQELLGSRTQPEFDPKKPTSNSKEQLERHSAERTDGVSRRKEADRFATAISRSFPAPIATEPVPGRIPSSSPTRRSPLSPRRPPNEIIAASPRLVQSKFALDHQWPIPKLVPRQEKSSRQSSVATSEPELPPTPVQLGIDTIPGRPRGLASSSSIGSKSGSGKHRRRVRVNGEAGINSSPLKPKNQRTFSPVDFSDDDIDEHGGGNEALESAAGTNPIGHGGFLHANIGNVVNSDHDDLDIETRHKTEELARLRKELERHQLDLGMITSTMNKLHHGANPDIEAIPFDLLRLEDTSRTVNMQSAETHPLFIANPLAYLGLFVPGNLLVKYETAAVQSQQRPMLSHKITMSPPSPWPTSAFQLSLNVDVDVEDAQIQRVRFNSTDNKDMNDMTAHSTSSNLPLNHWVQDRLGSDLHKFDVSGIVWGSARYFEACVDRAKVFRHLDEQYNRAPRLPLGNEPASSLTRKSHRAGNRKPNDDDDDDDCDLTSNDVIVLSRYIHNSQLLISNHNGSHSTPRTSESRSNSRRVVQILITYDIDITWTGDTTVDVKLSLQGLPSKVQVNVKRLFGKLLTQRGVVMAFEAVWNVLGLE